MQPWKHGELAAKAEKALHLLESCRFCPRNCRVNRLENQKGYCRTGRYALVSSYGPHFGEEAPLVGSGGSGTIFFTHCNLLCLFCQNYEISHLGEGREAEAQTLSRIMLDLQARGCHNINFVSPSHVLAQILEALPPAIEGGLRIPLVYNTGGYDSAEALGLLEGVFDIYMPDLKFMDGAISRKYCGAADYPERVREAILEMHRQTGDLAVDNRGIARRGLLIRHLVLPEGLAGTREAMRFLSREVSPRTYVNLMAQYRPCGRAGENPPLNRRPTAGELAEAFRIAEEEGIRRLDGRPGGRLF
jgi:putative pyruvate formate lyase activating enzyme